MYKLKQTGLTLGDTSVVGRYADDGLDFSKLKVYAVYNSGEKNLVEDYELQHKIDTSKVGKYTVKVLHNNFSKQFEYTVAKRVDARIGDVNFDGRVTAADARLALRAAAKLETLENNAFLAADIDFDERITASDARKILRVAAGLEKF